MCKSVTGLCKMSERKRGVFTTGQREYLQGEVDFSEYTKRSRIREHIHASLMDGSLLLNLPEEDRERIFNPRQSPSVDYESPLGDGEDKGQVQNRVDAKLESHELEKAIANFLAFIYVGLDKHRPEDAWPFDQILKNALLRVEREEGWVLEEFEFTANFDKSDGDLERRHERFKAGEASMNEATTLLQQGVIGDDEFKQYAEEYPISH